MKIRIRNPKKFILWTITFIFISFIPCIFVYLISQTNPDDRKLTLIQAIINLQCIQIGLILVGLFFYGCFKWYDYLVKD